MRSAVSTQADHTARERIVTATIEAIERGGEPAVRLVEVARAAGVTQGMISYYFDGREGLVAEAERRRFLGAVTEDAEVMSAIMETASDLGDYLERLEGVTRVVLTDARAVNRRVRITALGSAMLRPVLLEEVASHQRHLIDQMTAAVAVGQRRGFIREDLDARAIAAFTLSYALGLVVVDLDPDRPSDDALVAVIMGWVESLVPAPCRAGERGTSE